MNTLGADEAYARLVRRCLDGEEVETRGHKCRRTVGVAVAFDRTPLVSLRRTAWKGALREWEWFMSGSDRLDDLHPNVRHWWEPFCRDGRVPYSYGTQFRHFCGHKGYVDQIATLVKGLRDHPQSRRNVITTWNTADMHNPDTTLTSCHGTVIQAFVSKGRPGADDKGDSGLVLMTYQRSADVIVGLPCNWLQYWAFLLWLGKKTGHKPKGLAWTGGDVHVYNEHLGVAEKITRQPPKRSPELLYHPSTSEDFRADDFSLAGAYEPSLKDKVSMVV